MRRLRPRHVWIEEGSESALAAAVCAAARRDGIPVGHPGPDAPAPGRQDLVLRRQKGRWVRPFLTGLESAREYFLAVVQGCPGGCAYCFVQGHLDPGPTILFTNEEEGLSAIRAFLETPAARGARVHAAHLGELVLWDPWSGWTSSLVRLFAGFPETTLEIRTKLGIAPFEAFGPPPPNVVRSWTLTPAGSAARTESRLPGPDERLEAAARAAALGWRVGIRFDPMILAPGWEGEYTELLQAVARRLPARSLEAVEMGVFRCTKKAAEEIRSGPHRALVSGEFLPCADGKWRIFWPLRVKAYRWLVRSAREALGPSVPLRLCMEPPWVHRRVFGTMPVEDGCAPPSSP